MRLQGLVTAEGRPDVYVVLVGDAAEAVGLGLAERLRDAPSAPHVETHCGGGSFKAQLKRADRSGARYAVIIGDDEVARRAATVKALRSDAAQREVAFDDLATDLGRVLDLEAAST
jgi:histidyl-tRNA synthetase